MNHSMVECPFLHLMLFNQRVIQKYNYYKPNERKSFARKLRVKINARKKRKLCEFVSNTMRTEQVISDLNSLEKISLSSERALINNDIEKKKNCYNSSDNEEIPEENEEEDSENFVLNIADKTSSRIDFPNVLLDKECSIKAPEKKIKNVVLYTSSDFNNFLTIPPKQIDDESSLGIPGDNVNRNKFSINKVRSGNNLMKIMSSNTEKEKGNNLKFDLILIFEKQMDYENYFPHNNSHIVIQLYNKSLENDKIFKRYSLMTTYKKGRKSKMRIGFSINKESLLKQNESVVSILN